MKDLHYFRAGVVPVGQFVSFLVLNKSNDITFLQRGVNFAYFPMSLSIGLDPISSVIMIPGVLH